MISIYEKYLEIAVTMFIYISSAALTAAVLVHANEPIVVQGSDKTFVESTGVQQTYETDLYGRDLLLMLLNSDTMTPYPKAIKINNSPVIKLNSDFMAFQMDRITEIYVASGTYKLSTMLDYQVTSKEFVYDQVDSPYIQYVLEEVN